MTRKRVFESIRELFALRATISITDIELGYGTCAVLVILIGWFIIARFG